MMSSVQNEIVMICCLVSELRVLYIVKYDYWIDQSRLLIKSSSSYGTLKVVLPRRHFPNKFSPSILISLHLQSNDPPSNTLTPKGSSALHIHKYFTLHLLL